MRFLLSAPLILLVSATLGCGNDGLGGLPGIPVSLDISDHKIPGFAPPSAQASCAVNVPGSGALSTDSLQPISFDLKSSRELQGQSVLRFTKVKLEHVDLNVIPPSQAGQTWDFLRSLPPFAHVPGRRDPPLLVAELNPVPPVLTSIRSEGTRAGISAIAPADRRAVLGVLSR